MLKAKALPNDRLRIIDVKINRRNIALHNMQRLVVVFLLVFRPEACFVFFRARRCKLSVCSLARHPKVSLVANLIIRPSAA
jgi:hypothetical protein